MTQAGPGISLGGPWTRVTASRVRELVAHVCAAAGRISHRLGWMPAEGRSVLP